MVIAYETASGKNLGWWLDTLWTTLPYPIRVPTAYIISHKDGSPSWTSHYFRHTHIYPLLSLQRSLGDAYLSKFDETLGKGLAENYWSFNMYRRGGAQPCLPKTPEQSPSSHSSRSCRAWPLAYQPRHARHAYCLVYGMVGRRSHICHLLLYVRARSRGGMERKDTIGYRRNHRMIRKAHDKRLDI
jgi:hypothetical protein